MGELIDYRDGDAVCEAYVARPSVLPAPAVLVAHTWKGQGDLERARADALAADGYVGIAIDVYGKGRRGTDEASCIALSSEFGDDRAKLKRRMLAAVAFAAALDGVDPSRIAAIGYCFGGLCVLDLARSGTRDVAGVVSLHGLFDPPALGAQPSITAKILVLHGYDDPMAKPDAMIALADELTAAGADWQITAYGGTVHGFTNPAAAAPDRGIVYNSVAHRRADAATRAFLCELFDQ